MAAPDCVTLCFREGVLLVAIVGFLGCVRTPASAEAVYIITSEERLVNYIIADEQWAKALYINAQIPLNTYLPGSHSWFRHQGCFGGSRIGRGHNRSTIRDWVAGAREIDPSDLLSAVLLNID